jgi:TetR/AcrR family transcriptional regulator, transcriptional repressor for nem operon
MSMEFLNRRSAMRVSRKEAEANRERVVKVASALYRKHGFDGIGVADIMKKAGLTHGGFYGHFGSKDDLAAEACTCALSGLDSWGSASEKGGFEAAVRNYLTPEHRDDRAHGCLFAALGSDIARQPRTVRHAMTEGFRTAIDMLVRMVPGRSAEARRERALATMAGLVGALILSRAVDDSELSDQILEASAKTFLRPQV